MLWLLLQLAAVPPEPPPPADTLAAAVALWNEHPLPEAMRQRTIDTIILSTTYSTLNAAGFKDRRRWDAKFEQVRTWLIGRLPSDMSAVERQVTVCLADQIARTLTVDEIEDLRRFAATPSGEKYWQMTSWGSYRIDTCYRRALRIDLTPDDYRALGLKPPRFDPAINVVS